MNSKTLIDKWYQILHLFSIAVAPKFSVILTLFQPQSHYREVTWWEIFMEQELRFGLDLATFEAGFFMFSWTKNFFKNIVDGEKNCGLE